MKGVSTVIATVLMLIITIALAGTAYMYIAGVFTGTVQGIEVVDSRCERGVVTLIIRNIGTNTITSFDVRQTSPSDDLVALSWQGSIEPGRTINYQVFCFGIGSRSCVYRITPPVGKTAQAIATCVEKLNKLVVYDDADPTTFGGGWGWDGWQACCRDSNVKYSGSYSYRVEGGSEAWGSPLPDASNANYFMFAYKKQDPNCRANLYWYTNGDWHQVYEGTPPFWYPGFGIPYYADTNWHVVFIDLNTQVAGTDGNGNVNPRGVVTNFEYGPGGSCVIWYDYNYFG